MCVGVCESSMNTVFYLQVHKQWDMCNNIFINCHFISYALFSSRDLITDK